MEDLYNRILQMGIDRGYKNMTAICTAADVNRSIMTEYKKGRTLGLSLDTISKFSSLYDVPVDEILNGTTQGNLDHELRGYRMGREAEKETPAAPKNDGVAASEKARYVFENYDKMPPELKDIKAHILQTIKNYKPNCKPVERNRRPKLTW